jgi:hypothetical protein
MKTNIRKLSCVTFSCLAIFTGNLAIAQSETPVSNSITTVTTNTAVTTDTAMTTVTPVTTVTTVTPNTPVTSVTSVTTNTPVTTVTSTTLLTPQTTDSSFISSEGTVNELGQDRMYLKPSATADPVKYSYTKTTTYVDEDGNTVSRDIVTTGRPARVYYTQDGDERIAHKIVVKVHQGERKVESLIHRIFH